MQQRRCKINKIEFCRKGEKKIIQWFPLFNDFQNMENRVVKEGRGLTKITSSPENKIFSRNQSIPNKLRQNIVYSLEKLLRWIKCRNDSTWHARGVVTMHQ